MNTRQTSFEPLPARAGCGFDATRWMRQKTQNYDRLMQMVATMKSLYETKADNDQMRVLRRDG